MRTVKAAKKSDPVETIQYDGTADFELATRCKGIYIPFSTVDGEHLWTLHIPTNLVVIKGDWLFFHPDESVTRIRNEDFERNYVISEEV